VKSANNTGTLVEDLLRSFLEPSQNTLPLVTQTLRKMNELGTDTLDGPISLNMIEYQMRVRWLKDIRYLAISLKEAPDRTDLKSHMSAFSKSLAQLLT